MSSPEPGLIHRRHAALCLAATSRLSPYLAHGCLSARWLYAEVRAFEGFEHLDGYWHDGADLLVTTRGRHATLRVRSGATRRLPGVGGAARVVGGRGGSENVGGGLRYSEESWCSQKNLGGCGGARAVGERECRRMPEVL